jgi:hypothetical protein
VGALGSDGASPSHHVLRSFQHVMGGRSSLRVAACVICLSSASRKSQAVFRRFLRTVRYTGAAAGGARAGGVGQGVGTSPGRTTTAKAGVPACAETWMGGGSGRQRGGPSNLSILVALPHEQTRAGSLCGAWAPPETCRWPVARGRDRFFAAQQLRGSPSAEALARPQQQAFEVTQHGRPGVPGAMATMTRQEKKIR